MEVKVKVNYKYKLTKKATPCFSVFQIDHYIYLSQQEDFDRTL